jgi:hypothetical protein
MREKVKKKKKYMAINSQVKGTYLIRLMGE